MFGFDRENPENLLNFTEEILTFVKNLKQIELETDNSWVDSFDPDSLKVNNLGLKSHRCLGFTSDFMESLVLLGR